MVDRTGNGGSSFVCPGIESTLNPAAVLELLCLNHTHVLMKRKMFNALIKSLTEEQEEKKFFSFSLKFEKFRDREKNTIGLKILERTQQS